MISPFAVQSIRLFSILETCHLIVSHAPAVRHTAPSFVHPHCRRAMQILIVFIDQSFTVLHTRRPSLVRLAFSRFFCFTKKKKIGSVEFLPKFEKLNLKKSFFGSVSNNFGSEKKNCRLQIRVFGFRLFRLEL